jgi:hypothetical protein
VCGTAEMQHDPTLRRLSARPEQAPARALDGLATGAPLPAPTYVRRLRHTAGKRRRPAASLPYADCVDVTEGWVVQLFFAEPGKHAALPRARRSSVDSSGS